MTAGETAPESGSQDDAYLEQAMAEADATDTVIPDTAARMLASQLHGGQASALCSLASTGAIDISAIKREYLPYYVDAETPEETIDKLDHLGLYCMDRGNRGAVPDWAELWGTP